MWNTTEQATVLEFVEWARS